MSLVIDIAFFSKSSAALHEWMEASARMNEALDMEVQSLVCEILGSDGANSYAKSTAAYLAGRFKVAAALPLLAGAIGEDWIGSRSGMILFRCNPDAALLSYGPVARPAIEGILATTQRADLVTLATIMVFNVTGSKAEAKKSLLAALEARPAADRPLFEDALKGIEVWKE